MMSPAQNRAKCKRCGMTIREFGIVEKGRVRMAWLALIKGTWSEACPSSFLFRKRHLPE